MKLNIRQQVAIITVCSALIIAPLFYLFVRAVICEASGGALFREDDGYGFVCKENK